MNVVRTKKVVPDEIMKGEVGSPVMEMNIFS